MNRKITQRISHFVKGRNIRREKGALTGKGEKDGWRGRGWGGLGVVGGGLEHAMLIATLKLSKHFSNTITVLSRRPSGERRREQKKNVIYKASVDWNVSSDPLADAQLICSWFQTTPPGRPQGTFFRFYAWIYLFNSPFTKTTADDSPNKSLRSGKKTINAHMQTHNCNPLSCPALRGIQRGEKRKEKFIIDKYFYFNKNYFKI